MFVSYRKSCAVGSTDLDSDERRFSIPFVYMRCKNVISAGREWREEYKLWQNTILKNMIIWIYSSGLKASFKVESKFYKEKKKSAYCLKKSTFCYFVGEVILYRPWNITHPKCPEYWMQFCGFRFGTEWYWSMHCIVWLKGILTLTYITCFI